MSSSTSTARRKQGTGGGGLSSFGSSATNAILSAVGAASSRTGNTRSSTRSSARSSDDTKVTTGSNIVDQFAAKAEQAIKNEVDVKRLVASTDIELVGRSEEKAHLKNAIDGSFSYSSSSSSKRRKRPRVISITGKAGTGKSSLVKDAQVKDHGYICRGKYTPSGDETGLSRCIKDLVHQIVDRDLDMGIRRRLQESIRSTDAAVLIESFPALSLLFQAADEDGTIAKATPDTSETDKVRRAKRKHFLFVQLIEVLVNHKQNQYEDENITAEERQENPTAPTQHQTQSLVMIIDDLQWVDIPSMELISALVRDPDLENFLLITTSRPPDGEDRASTINFLQEVDRWANHNIPMESIHMENLKEGDVVELVAQLLGSEPSEIAPLGEAVFEKTAGNPFFTTEFLKRLVEEKLVKYNFGALQWNYDIQKIKYTEMNANNAVALVRGRLRGLSTPYQILLLVAGCLGASFDKNLLENIILNIDVSTILDNGAMLESVNIQKFLTACVKDFAVLDCCSDKKQYFFVHDLTKEAALGFGNEQQNGLLKMRVGNCILQTQGSRATNDESGSDSMLFVGVDMCNRSKALLADSEPEEWINLARYNLLAGQKAMRESAFALALHYTETGVIFLDSFELSQEGFTVLLDLLAGAAEAAYCLGNYQKMSSFSNRVLYTPYCPKETRLQMMYFQILSSVSQERSKDAVLMGRKAIGLLGVGTFPRNPGTATVLVELLKTMRLLRNHTEETLLALPDLKDENRITAMRFIDAIQTPAYITNPNFFVVLFLRTLRWSVKYGISQYSPVLFTMWGLHLNNMFGNSEGNMTYCGVALKLAERLDVRETTSRTSMICFGMSRPWNTEMRSCYQPIVYSHKLAMEVGDTETALQCLVFMDQTAWCSAMFPLQKLARDLGDHCTLCREFEHQAYLDALSGLATDLGRLCRSDDEAFAWLQTPGIRRVKPGESDKPHDLAIQAFYDAIKLQIHYILGERKEMMEFAKKTAGLGITVSQGQNYVTRTQFYRGLVFLGEACDGKNTRANLRASKKIIAMIRKWVAGGSVDCVHMLRLLDAEVARVEKKTEVAKDLYGEAIQISLKTGHSHDAGVCHERAAVFYLESGDDTRAAHHIEQAEKAFEEWGASAKIQQLHETYAHLLECHGSTVFAVRSSANKGLSELLLAARKK